MTLKAVVPSLDEVDEAYRDEYTETEGGFRLKALDGFVSVDDIENHEKTQGLKSALDKERETRREAERKAKALEDNQLTDEDRAELSQLREARQAAEDARKRKEGEFDKWREETTAAHAKETEDLVARTKSLESMLLEGEAARQIADACNEFGGRANILAPLVQQSIQKQFSEDGTRLEITVHDAEGTKLLDTEGKPLTISGFVKKMSESKDFADLFASQQKGGGGSDGSSGDGGGTDGKGEKPNTDGLYRDSMSRREKVDFIKEHGQAEFMKLPLAKAG